MDGLRVTTCYGMRTTFGLYITIYTLARVAVIITGSGPEKTDSNFTEFFTPGIASSLSSYSSSPSTSLSYQTTTIEASVFPSTPYSESATHQVSTNPASDASDIDSSLSSYSSSPSPSTSLSYRTTAIEASDFSSSQESTASVFPSTSYSESATHQVSTNPASDASHINSSLSSYSSSPSPLLSYQTTTIEASDFSSSQELTASVFPSTSYPDSATHRVSTNPAAHASDIASSLSSYSSSPSTSLSYQTTTIEASDFSSSQELTASVFPSTSYPDSAKHQVSTNPASHASDFASSLSSYSSSPSTSLSYQTTAIEASDFSSSQELTASVFPSTSYPDFATHQVSTTPVSHATDIDSSLSAYSSSPSTSVSHQTTTIGASDFSSSQELTASVFPSTSYPDSATHQVSTTPVFTSTSYSELTTPQWSTNSVLTTTQHLESFNTESVDSTLTAITETAPGVTLMDNSYTVQSSNKNPSETTISSSASSDGGGSEQVSSSSDTLASGSGTLSAEHKTSTSTMGTETISDAFVTEVFDPDSTVTIPTHTTVIVSAPISSYTPDTVHTLSPTTKSLEETITVDTTSISSTSDTTIETTPSYTYPTKYPNVEKATYVLQLTLEILNEKLTREEIEKEVYVNSNLNYRSSGLAGKLNTFRNVFKNVTGFQYVRVEAWTGTSTLSINTVFKATDLTPISKRSKGVSSGFATELYTALCQSPVINFDVKEDWVSWNNSIIKEKLSSLCLAEDYCEFGYHCIPPEDKVCGSLCDITACGENRECIIIVEDNVAKIVCRCETNGNVVLQENNCEGPAALVSGEFTDSTDNQTIVIVFGIIAAVCDIAMVIMYFTTIRKRRKKKTNYEVSPPANNVRAHLSLDCCDLSANDDP